MKRPKRELRDVAIMLRVTAAERGRLVRAAALMSLPLSGWMRMILLREIKLGKKTAGDPRA